MTGTITPFRFAVGAPSHVESRAELVRHVRFAESAGYSATTFPDHHFLPLSPIVAMAVAAEATSTFRVGTLVLANDFRHPAVLAKDLATLDLLTEGRVEVGIGGGWMRSDYDSFGIEFHGPGARIERLAETMDILKGIWSGRPFAYDGVHYKLAEATGKPTPVQPAGPPLLVGGGMQRILSLAGRRADIVTIAAQAIGAAGSSVVEGAARLAERVAWVKAAASGREQPPELHILLSGIAINDDRRAGAHDCTSAMAALQASLGSTGVQIDEDELLVSPFHTIGSVAHIVEQLQALRETHGISYFSVMEPVAHAFAPIVEALSGR